MKTLNFVRNSFFIATGALTCLSAQANPGNPTIAWMEVNYSAPANYTVNWNMWWGENANVWHLLENNQIIHTASLTKNGLEAQAGQYNVSQPSGGSYVYQVRLCDTTLSPPLCSDSATQTITVAGASVNQAPIVNAGTDKTNELGSSTTLNGSYTDDGLSTPITQTWSKASGPGTATFSNVNIGNTTVSFSAEGDYSLQLTVSDGEFTVSDEMVVNVNAIQPNQAPLANAGTDQSVTINQAITLNGTYTDDGKTSPITQLWSKVSGVGNVAFANAELGNSTATFSTAGTYVLNYIVDDSEFSSSDQVSITVTDAGNLEKPFTPEIAWRTPEVAITNGSALIDLTWNKYSGVSGNHWYLLQNGVDIYDATIAENGNNLQTANTTATVTQAGSYQFVVKLCNKSGSEQNCSESTPMIITVTGGEGTTTSDCSANSSDAPCLPYRADPVKLNVKGWPEYLAMGSITDNDFGLDQAFASAKLDAIFKYSGNGSGDRGVVIEPTVTAQTLTQARNIELLNGIKVMPTMVVYTANASGGGVAAEDITNYSNLVKHYQNLIRLTVLMQINKDTDHPNPGTIILNADLLGEWQKGLNTHFKVAFGDKNGWTEVLVKQALKEAIDNEASHPLTALNGSIHTIESLYNLVTLKQELDSNLTNNIKGWVQSQNFIIKRFSPDVTFSWLVNLWSPGSANWVHNNFSGHEAVWNNSSKSVAKFIDEIGAYQDNAYQPDFLTFDKYERDGFSPEGRGNYAFGAREWGNYLNYVRQVTDHLNTPAMIWQIPGGHMAANSENIGSYDLANHSASGASYFMGDKNIGENINNIRSEVLDIALNGVVYDGATSVRALLQQTPSHDWGQNQLRQAAYSNVFSILWGGGSTTGVIPINTNGSGDNNWLRNKVADYHTRGKIPLYHVESSTNTSTALTTIDTLNADLLAIESKMNNEIFLYETPDSTWVPSTIYKWADFLAALNPMHNVGVEDVKFWLIDPNADDATNIKYAKVAIAAFLSQSMKETIQFNACDENNWSLNTGDPVDYPVSAACGQLGQVYDNYGTDAQGNDNPYSCPRNEKMEISALTHAKWYGAPAPLFTAPDAVLAEKGLLVNGHVGRWNYSTHCNVPGADIDGNKQVYLRDECKVYEGQKAGKFIWDGSAGKSIQGCGWWGRGVIQTTGRLNFGKLNHFIGRSHVDRDNVGQVVAGTLVKQAPENPLYPDLDLCSNPELVCSTQEHKEIKWIAGIFFWMNEVQGYNNVGGPYASWNYHEQLKAYVDGGLTGSKFIDDVSGIVNRGCPDVSCPVSGSVDGLVKRKENFIKALKAMGLDPK